MTSVTDNRTTERVDHPPRVRDAIDELMHKKDATDNRTTELESLSKLKKAGKLRYWRETIEIPETELHAICDEIQAEHDQAIAATLGSEREKAAENRGHTYDLLRGLLEECKKCPDTWCAQYIEKEVIPHMTTKEIDKTVEDSIKGLEADIWRSCEHLTMANNGEMLVNVPWEKLREWFAIAATLGRKELERENSKLEHKMSNMETKLLKAQERIDELIIAATPGWIEEPDTIRNELTDSGLIDTRAAHDTLTPERVRDAIFNGSAYASYDGSQYYANGIDMQAIADELNAALGGGECEWTLVEKWPNRTGDDHVYGYETGCGVRHTWWPDSLPNFCPTCGERVKAVKR